MIAPPSIAQAFDLVMWINRALHELPIPASDRNRISGACFAVALEHHHAVVLLLRERLNGSAFALMRGEYEAYVRGLWLAHSATEQELSAFISGAKPPELAVMLSAIESRPTFDSKTLSAIKASSWNSMCSYTHTGSLQVQRWNTSEAIESRHSPEEIDEVLGFTNAIALLAAVGVSALADNGTVAARLLEKFRAIAKPA